MSNDPAISDEMVGRCMVFVGNRFRTAPNARSIFPAIDTAVTVANAVNNKLIAPNEARAI
jgi:hypothetical protein